MIAGKTFFFLQVSPTMNVLHIWFSTKRLTSKQLSLWLGDDFPRVSRATYFGPQVHNFNPFTGIDYRKAGDLAAFIYGISREGENTVTVRNIRRAWPGHA